MKRDDVTVRVRIPEELWRQYKGLCIARGLPVTDPLILFMRQAVEQWQREHGRSREDPNQGA